MPKTPQNSGRKGKGSKRTPPVGRRFPKGQSGNPGGRPKVPPEHREAAQEHVPEVLETWVKIMRSKKTSPGTRAYVGDLIYSRAYGKPAQQISASLTTDPAVRLQHELVRMALRDPAAGKHLDAAAARLELVAGEPGGLRKPTE